MKARIVAGLHPKQKAFFDSKAKYRAFIGGIGSGKSYVGCLSGLIMASTHPKTLGVIVAPSYPMLRDATMRAFFDICPRDLYFPEEWHRADKELVLKNGSTILFRSASDPDSLRGPNLDWFVFDEGSVTPTREAWDILSGRIRVRGRINRGMVCCTPKGLNWVYDIFVKNPTSDHEWFHATTMDNRDNLDPKAISSLLESYTGQFLRQELYGEFVAFEGLVYSGFNAKHNMVREYNRDSIKRYVVGVDFGYTNPMAMLVIGLDHDDRAIVVHEVYEKGVTPEQLKAMALEIENAYHPDNYWCDPARPELIMSLQEEGLNALPALNDVMKGISVVASRLPIYADGLPRLTVHESCVNTLTEFMQYRYKEVKEGVPVKEEPLKIFDHAMDALRYALYSLDRQDITMIGGLGSDILR